MDPRLLDRRKLYCPQESPYGIMALVLSFPSSNPSPSSPVVRKPPLLALVTAWTLPFKVLLLLRFLCCLLFL